MQKRIPSAIKRHTLWLSLLFHLLFMLNFSLMWMQPAEKDPSPSLEIPSYVYNEPLTPAASSQPTQQDSTQKAKPTDKNGIEKPSPEASNTMPLPSQQPMSKPKPIIPAKTKPEEDPVRLIGDSKVVKPLIKILGKALTAHLVYPRIAVDFNLRGTVHVGFLLSPNGQISNAEVVKSSGAGVLDEAALKAVNAMSPVMGVTPYVDQPRFLVVGIIFG